MQRSITPVFQKYISISLENQPLLSLFSLTATGAAAHDPGPYLIGVTVPVFKSHLLLTFYSRCIFYSALDWKIRWTSAIESILPVRVWLETLGYSFWCLKILFISLFRIVIQKSELQEIRLPDIIVQHSVTFMLFYCKGFYFWRGYPEINFWSFYLLSLWSIPFHSLDFCKQWN